MHGLRLNCNITKQIETAAPQTSGAHARMHAAITILRIAAMPLYANHVLYAYEGGRDNVVIYHAAHGWLRASDAENMIIIHDGNVMMATML